MIDKTSVGLAQQLLNLLMKGLQENLWPSYVLDYDKQGLQNDLAVVYHMLAFSSSRGFILGLKAGEAGVQKALKDAEEVLATATKAQDLELEYSGPSMDDAVQRKLGIQGALERLHEILDRQKVPGV